LVKHHDHIPNDIARLKGIRLVTAIETEEGKRLAESLVKQATGGEDKMVGRFLHHEFFEFKPTFKIFFATNHKPVIRGTDHAIWRRIRLIPFTVTIPEIEQDKELPEKLRGELPGILAWAVRGCLAWQREGLGTPEEVKRATANYRIESDVLAAFLAECTVQRFDAHIRAGEFYQAYKSWCEKNSERPITGTVFGRRLTEMGLDKYRDAHGWQYVGIGLLAAELPSI
jgi:putative DNA primase/helicase